MNTPQRKFEDIQARREQVPLLVGLVGPSGSGKTYSALRLATGIQRITGGDIYGIDTESRRMLHYADTFKFRHLQFGAPFSPLDYLAAIQHCIDKGAKTIVIDSMSHEHEGPGGVLEMHEEAMGGDFKKQFIAWGKPKAMRRRLINSMLQLNANFIMCYRAKEKLKIVRGRDPEPRGWQPIAGEEYVYEATLNCLLLPASNGVPMWRPEHDNEGMIKLPAQFRGIFENGPQLSEEIGEKLAQWAKGGAPAKAPDTPKAIAMKAWQEANPGADLKSGLKAAKDAYFGVGDAPLTDDQWRKFVADGFKRKPDSEQSLQSAHPEFPEEPLSSETNVPPDFLPSESSPADGTGDSISDLERHALVDELSLQEWPHFVGDWKKLMNGKVPDADFDTGVKLLVGKRKVADVQLNERKRWIEASLDGRMNWSKGLILPAMQPA